jgi:type VI protein secretion system component VasF
MATMNERMKDFERRSRAAFDDSVAALDGETRSRLARARQLALAEIRHRPMSWLSTWVPAGAVAAAALMALLLWTGNEPGPEADPTVIALEELDIVTAGDDLDMLGEDPGFYAWATDELAGGVS